MRIIYNLLFVFLLFEIPSVFAQSQFNTPVSNSAVLTDEQWLKSLKLFGVSDVRDLLPFLKTQLDLTQEQTDSVEQLLNSYDQYDLNARGAVNADNAQLKDSSVDKVQQDEADDAYKDVLENVHEVRVFLGDHDIDFREWFGEEMAIQMNLDMHYMGLRGRDYPSDEAINETINKIESTPTFLIFKSEKEKKFNSEVRTNQYFDKWKLLIADIFLFRLDKLRAPLTMAGFDEYKSGHQKLFQKADVDAKDLCLIDFSVGK
jgi:hypothetical protein